MTDEGRRGERERRIDRTKERLGIVLVVVVAIAAGVLAANLGTHRSWEHQTSVNGLSSTSVPRARNS